tara:strand:+ start:168 stop:374 length:207 start_codon:yes stop_codon:yes gene_type:complete
MEEYFSIVKRPSGFFIVDFESVEEDLEPTAKVIGAFATEESASQFITKFICDGYGGDGLLFFKGGDDG